MVPAPLACMKIANAYYSQIDSGLDAIGRTSAMVAASVLIPITSFITIPAALFGSSAVRASKKKKFLATEAGKDMMKCSKLYRISKKFRNKIRNFFLAW